MWAFLTQGSAACGLLRISPTSSPAIAAAS
jgi:hypothetical protein